MKTISLFTCCFLCTLISCTHEGVAPSDVRPSREIHFDFETGVKIAEKTFVYDDNNNLVRESFTDLSSTYSNFDVFYEYDGEGNVLKEKRSYPGIVQVTEYTYSGGRKLTETNFVEAGKPLGHIEYFYGTSNEPDSVRRFFYSTVDQKYLYGNSSIYSYDASGRLKTEIITSHGDLPAGRVEYSYDGKNLTSACDVSAGSIGEDFFSCTVKQYDRNGRVARILSETSSGFSELKEEFFYNGGLLHEKRIYSYPAYDPNNTLEVTQIRYQY